MLRELEGSGFEFLSHRISYEEIGASTEERVEFGARFFRGATSAATIGTLRSDDGDSNGNATKTIGLISKTKILLVHHAFLYISLPSLHDYDVKMPNFTMYTGSTQATTKFPLSF